jgi:hypothetical protein
MGCGLAFASLRRHGMTVETRNSERADGTGVDCRDGRQREDFPMVSSPRRRLSLKARQALELLAIDQRGLAEALLLTYGFTRDLLAGLVGTGLATAQRQTVKAGGKTIRVVRIRITEAGRRALEGLSARPGSPD